MKILLLVLVTIACTIAFPVAEEKPKPETPVVPAAEAVKVTEEKKEVVDAVKKEVVPEPAKEEVKTEVVPEKVEEPKPVAAEPKSEVVAAAKPEEKKEAEVPKEEVKVEAPKEEVKSEATAVAPPAVAVQEEKKSEPVVNTAENLVALAPAPDSDTETASAPVALADSPAEAATTIVDSPTTDSAVDPVTATSAPLKEKDEVKTEEVKPTETKKEDKSSEESKESEEESEKKQKDQAKSSEESDEVVPKPVVPNYDATKVESKPQAPPTDSKVTTTFLTDVIKPIPQKPANSS